MMRSKCVDMMRRRLTASLAAGKLPAQWPPPSAAPSAASSPSSPCSSSPLSSRASASAVAAAAAGEASGSGAGTAAAWSPAPAPALPAAASASPSRPLAGDAASTLAPAAPPSALAAKEKSGSAQIALTSFAPCLSTANASSRSCVPHTHQPGSRARGGFVSRIGRCLQSELRHRTFCRMSMIAQCFLMRLALLYEISCRFNLGFFVSGDVVVPVPSGPGSLRDGSCASPATPSAPAPISSSLSPSGSTSPPPSAPAPAGEASCFLSCM
mmetsp:Transcript_8537/g.34711  ORF Transcript_8537/g.34711 Transcript_8537/m.34711 type:complete len:269 (+) Transcript_8537:371-1177(+)